MAEATASTNDATPAPASSKLPLVIAVVVSLAAGAGGAWFFASRGAGAPAAEAGAEHGGAEEAAPAEGHEGAGPAAGASIPLEPFLVNLVSDEGTRYLKVKLELELDSAAAKADLEAKIAKVRDAVIALLSSRRIDDVVSFEGKALLKQEIGDRVSAVLAKGRVKAVMFTDFVVQ